MQYAVAATVLLGMFAVFNVFRAPPVEIVRVASIQKSIGPVYLLGEQAELRPTDDLSNVLAGQTIVTGNGAGLALALDNGGSVRVDANTRIKFTDSDSVFLESGRVYFDSMPSSLVAGIGADDAPEFVVQTEHGSVQHVGTQFMTKVAANMLVVSVREGSVSIDGEFHDHTATLGQQVTYAGRQRPSVLSIERSGDAWSWVNRITPAADVDGKTLHEFLVWVCREMGLELQFEGQAETVAQDAEMMGSIDMEPAEELRIRLAAAALDWSIEQGVIHITDKR